MFCRKGEQKPGSRRGHRGSPRTVCVEQSKGRHLRNLARKRFQRSLDTGRRKEESILKLQRTFSRVVKKIDLDQINLG